MPILNCRPFIKNLLREALGLSSAGKLTIGSTEGMPNPFDYTALYYRLGEKLARLYMDALNRLRWELHPQHAEDATVIEGLWALFTQVASDVAQFSGKSTLNQRLDDFGRQLKLPLSDFEVAYAIEFMDIGTNPFSIGPVTFVGPHDKTGSNWATDTTWWPRGPSHSGLISAAYTRVAGADYSRASEAGIHQVSDAIDVLRVAALRGLAGRSADDELLQWRMTGAWAVRAVGDSSPQVFSGWRRPFKPLVMDLGSAIQAGLKGVPFNEIVSNTLQPDIQRRLLRAVHWVSGSVVHQDHDHKIVDLCTALEVMLLPNYRGAGKGELIALRYNLLGGYLNPPAIKGLYDRRSDIVHGSKVGEVGLLDTWHLRLECDTVLRRILEIAKPSPNIKTLEELIATVETREKLEEFIHRCETGTYEGTGLGKIKGAAKALLKQVAGGSPIAR